MVRARPGEPDQGTYALIAIDRAAAQHHKKRHVHAHGIAGPTPTPAQRAGAMTDAAGV
jgi:hypothetical protein